MRNHYDRILKDTDRRVSMAIKRQEKNRNSPVYGGFYEENGLIQAKSSIYKCATLISAYCNVESTYYHNQEIYHRIHIALEYIKKVQHENGLFDYITCNFYSAPDTAFCIKKLYPILLYLNQFKSTPEEECIYEKVNDITFHGARGLLLGGFHTPNHRWVIASNLLAYGEFYKDEKMKEVAHSYLKEGIDCNEDGEFAEKSAGNYNRINNDAMITISEVTGDPFYEECAIRNLNMMLTYWEPDFSIFTANSTRFDKDILIYPKDYYMEYLKLGNKYHITEFLHMANRIFEVIEEKNLSAPDILIWFMLHKEYKDIEIEGTYEPKMFQVYYQDSGIARIRRSNYTCTVMKGKSNFLYYNNGAIRLGVKLAGSFCEHRSFIAEKMEETSVGYHLRQVMKGWYYLPFEEPRETTDWWEMDNENRKRLIGPEMYIDVFMTPVEDGIDICFETRGVKGAPWRIEIAFEGIKYLSSDYVTMPVNGSETIVLKEGMCVVENNISALSVGPCFGYHRFIEGKEDSEEKVPGLATVYCTDYTEFKHKISIREC